MLYVYENGQQWLVSRSPDFKHDDDTLGPVPLSAKHQIMIIKRSVQFLILDPKDWAIMQTEYPNMYSCLYNDMYLSKPRTSAAGTLARLQAYMNTYDALATYYAYVNHTYALYMGVGKHLHRPWSLYTFLRLVHRFVRTQNRCWEA